MCRTSPATTSCAPRFRPVSTSHAPSAQSASRPMPCRTTAMFSRVMMEMSVPRSCCTAADLTAFDSATSESRSSAPRNSRTASRRACAGPGSSRASSRAVDRSRGNLGMLVVLQCSEVPPRGARSRRRIDSRGPGPRGAQRQHDTRPVPPGPQRSLHKSLNRSWYRSEASATHSGGAHETVAAVPLPLDGGVRRIAASVMTTTRSTRMRSTTPMRSMMTTHSTTTTPA